MRIKRLEIYGYGKWVDTTFDLPQNVHLFYGVNEAGKSTLMSFIHSILFGFPTRNSTLLRYEPRESSRYGGKIYGEDARFGEVMIERIHGKVTGDVTVTLEDGTIGHEELLDSVLYGMDRTMYQNIFSFSLTDIEHVHQLSEDQLSRYLLTIGAHGTEYYLDLVDQFRADANKLYRPSGRVLELNKQLETLKKQEKLLNELEQRNESYLGLIEQNNVQNKEIQALEMKEERLENQLADIREFKKKRHVLEEIQTLEKEIAQVHLPPLKEDGRYLLGEYKRELSALHEQIQINERQQSEQKKQVANVELIEVYQDNQRTIEALENELPEMIEELRDFEAVNEKRTETQKNLTRLEETLGIQHQPEYPTAFSDAEQQEIASWLTAYEKNQNVGTELLAHIQATANELNLKNQKLDQYEAMMWDAQELKQAEDELQTEKTPRKSGQLLTVLVGLALIGGAFLVDAPLNAVLGIVGLLVVVFSLLLGRKPQKQPNDYLQKEYARQLTLKDEWQEALGESDAIQAAHQSLLDRQMALQKTQQSFIGQWQNLLNVHVLPGYLPFEEAERVILNVQALHDLLAQDQAQNAQQIGLKKALDEKTSVIARLVELPASASIQEKIAAFREYNMRLKAEISKEQDKLNQLNALKHEEDQLVTSQRTTQEKIKHLLETADVETEEDFGALYQQKEMLDGKKSRLHFLKENTPDFDSSKKLATAAEVAATEQKIEDKRATLIAEKKEAIRKQASTKLSIEHLEKDGTYTEELQVFENQKATTQRLFDDWIANKLAAGMIQETLSGVTKDRFQEIIADARDYFYLLTDEEYERIIFRDEKLFVQNKKGHVVDVRALSRGTAEPLYVSIRLAYIKNTQDVLELPIIMDDPFVNFDEKRRRNMYRLLETLSKDLQIIYFTFDQEAFTSFSQHQRVNLEKRKTND